MEVLGEDAMSLRVELAKREDIKKTYQRALGYMQQISQIQASYNNQQSTM